MQILAKYKGWGLTEEFKFVHLVDGGIVKRCVTCDKCLQFLPEEQWDHLYKILVLLDDRFTIKHI